jgi:hypothetical protein
MHFFFLHPIKSGAEEEHTLVPLHALQHNTSEGSEFLDDAIRMEDLSLTHTEECIAAGSPERLL